MDMPPTVLNDQFFHWLRARQGELKRRIVYLEGYLDDEIDVIQQTVGCQLPEELRVFYRHCDPWCPLRDWRAWDSVKAMFEDLRPADSFVAPIDNGYSVAGQETVTFITPKLIRGIVSRSRNSEATCWYGGVREYLVDMVERELSVRKGSRG